MKLKYYLRGIGIGLIITTLVMTAAFMLHKDDLISDEEICERAAALGMVMPDEDTGGRDTLSNNKTSPQELLDSAPDEKKDGASGEETDKNASGTNDNKNAFDKKDDKKNGGDDKKNDDQGDTAAKDEPAPPEVSEEVEISIVGGEYSDIVSQKLFKAGLIDDAEAFNKFLANGGYDNLIQPGTYMIPVGVDYKAIVDIITEKE